MKEGVDIDIVEDGKSFEENAMIKAAAIAELPGSEGNGCDCAGR